MDDVWKQEFSQYDKYLHELLETENMERLQVAIRNLRLIGETTRKNNRFTMQIEEDMERLEDMFNDLVKRKEEHLG